MSEEKRFPYLLDKRFIGVWKAFGVGADDGVVVDDDTFTATYGRLKFSTPRSNVKGAHLTENYRWWTSVGVRLSFADSGLTFGTTNRRGVCVHFAEPVAWKVPGRSHSALTATVKDCEGLIDELGSDEPSS